MRHWHNSSGPFALYEHGNSAPIIMHLRYRRVQRARVPEMGDNFKG